MSHIIVSSLFPPKLHLQTSFSDLSIASSRSATPEPSIASTPSPGTNSSPRSSIHIIPHPIHEFVPRIASHLNARDILSLSATARLCRDLRTHQAFRRHLVLNGWDVGALERRTELLKDTKGRPWMFLARSALAKDDLSTQYSSLPKEGNKLSQNDKNAVKRYFRVLVDIATEHEKHNFETLASIAAVHGKSLIRFVSDVQAHDWRTRYRKTFVIAAFIHSQSQHLADSVPDLEALADTLSFDAPTPPLSFLAARANFLYAYAAASEPCKLAAAPVPNTVYDSPHICTSNGTPLPGVHHAMSRLVRRTAVSGTYHKPGGVVTTLHMALEPRGLSSRFKLPFTDKNTLLTLSATVSDDEGNTPWHIEGYVDRKKGAGKLKDKTGEMSWEVCLTPWGLTGEKIRGEGKHLGYFVLHWVK